MYSAAIYIGGIVRWILKGCKTNLKDELSGRLNPTWGGSYDLENFIVGIIFTAIILGLIIWLVF
ncbi:MAG: hypothetical protein M0Q51_11945 [Bacteroidales bacterium]|nr:hypothetical protein [Bacteroidales bacterium]